MGKKDGFDYEADGNEEVTLHEELAEDADAAPDEPAYVDSDAFEDEAPVVSGPEDDVDESDVELPEGAALSDEPGAEEGPVEESDAQQDPKDPSAV